MNDVTVSKINDDTKIDAFLHFVKDELKATNVIILTVNKAREANNYMLCEDYGTAGKMLAVALDAFENHKVEQKESKL